jgi:DNA-binding Lrp family transcriptional regulator
MGQVVPQGAAGTWRNILNYMIPVMNLPMAKTKPLQVFRDETLSLEARMIAAIEAVGPRNVAQIARLAGAHQETVRYKIKKQFAGRGFRFQAEVDYHKLGLSLHWATFEVAPIYYATAPRLFDAMNGAAYLVHYSKVLPGGYFVALFALPAGRGPDFARFLGTLQKRKIINGFTLNEVVAERHKPMDVKHFDFRASRWEVDWQKIRNSPSVPLTIDRSRRERVADEVDMLLIKELQKDALQHTVGIARRVKVNAKTLEYHYRVHVVKRQLIPRYRVRWMRDLTKTMAHSTVVVRMTFKGLDPRSYQRVQATVGRIPFLWFEARLDDGTYFATLSIPVTDFLETMSYVNSELQSLGPGVELGYMKVGDSFNFTIPYHMFSKGEWRFDAKNMEASVMKGLSEGLEK